MGAPSVQLIPTYRKNKQQAIKLRQKGWSYKEIADKFEISKGTAYLWTRKVKLSKSAQQRIERKIKRGIAKGLIAYNKLYGPIRSQEANKLREKYKNKSCREIKNLSPKDLKLIGAALYWAEGDKKNRNMFRFSNSDSSMIKIMMKFLEETAKIPKEKITARMHLYPQINPKTALSYWSKITNLPKKRFSKPFFQISKASKHKRSSNTLPYGTLHLEVYNTELTWKTRGWIQGIIQKIS